MRHWSDGGDLAITTGNGPHYWDKGFHEIVSACPSGVAPCTFAFQDVYGNVLVVSTMGEVAPEVGVEAVVTRWTLEENDPPMLVAEPNRKHAGELISVMRQLTPPNILVAIPLGTPSEKVRERLGVQDVIEGNRWKYRFEDTQVEIAFDAVGSVKTLVVALVLNSKFRGVGAPFGDFALGELTINELTEMGHQTLVYRSSLRTKELVVPVRTGPSGAWDECFFGALVVHSGVGWLAETDFQWSVTEDQLTSSSDRTTLNWVGVGTDHGEPPYIDWYIKA
ncbi:hypothetical protein LHU53_19225 [Rhodoferax sp. U2-2l]|uniref:hypothetical protein n=1 Tax=Rhodoferax sp. U2-2l TaxID=2884000 RepID=UPI001D0B4146|nr:hypothetical protein [Rhodoferax sp. U2-2l]MCB8749025.1 hypothetical protein [Rhodoferax sp. U2-2l]